MDPAMVPVYRKMSPGERIEAGLSATELVRDRLRAEFAERHPDWTGAQVEEAVAHRLLTARDGI